MCGKSQESRFDFCNLMVIFGSIWRINNWRSLLNWIEFDEGGSAAQRGFMTILSTWYNPNLSKRRFSTRWHLEMENLQAFPLNPQIEKIHNHHQNCFHHHNQTVDCLTGRLDNFGSCLKLSIAEEPSPCSAEQLLFSPFLSSISWRLFSKAIVNHLQQLGTSVWSHRSPCGLRENQFWTRFVFCFTILSVTTIDNTNPISSLGCL